MQMATQKTVRVVSLYRKQMESEVDRLKQQLESTSKEVESAARDVGRPLPDDWDAPIHIATKRTIRQVEVYCTSMQAEVEHLTASLETSSKMERIATMRATALAEELASETRKKEMHHEKARQFYAEAQAAKEAAAASSAALARVQAELDRQLGGEK